MKRILVLPDDWETWVSLEGDLKPEVWCVTDEAYAALEDGAHPADFLEDGKLLSREVLRPRWRVEEMRP